MSKKFVILLSGLGIVVVNFIPQLFLSKAFFNGDSLFAFYPALSFYKTQIVLHQSILWTRAMLGGFPIYLDLLGGFYSPINFILFKYFSVITAYNLALMVGIGLLFWFTYLLAREFKISRHGALLTAMVFSFGFHIANWSNNLTVVNALFILPLLLLCISKIFSGRYYWIVIGVLGVGYSFLNGQPQWVLMAFVASGFCLVYLLWPAIKKFKETFKSWRSFAPLYGFLVIVILGIAIASFQLLPSQTMALLSSRAGGLSFQDASISAQTPFDWLWYILPDLQFRWLSASEPTLYVGIIPLILGLMALFSGIKKDTRIKFFSFLWLFGLATALRFSPIFWLLHHLPVFSLFRGPNRWMYLGNLGLALLAGIGFDAIIDNEISDKIKLISKKIATRTMVVVVALITLVNIVYFVFGNKIIALVFSYFKNHLYHKTTKLPLDYYLNYLKSLFADNFRSVSLLNIRLIIAIIFLVTGVWFMRKLQRDGFTGSKYFFWIVIGLSAVNLLALHPNYYETIPRNIIEQSPQTATVINTREAGEEHMFRVLPILTGIAMGQDLYTPHFAEYTQADAVVLGRDMLENNIGLLYGIDYIDGYSNLMSRRVSRVDAILGSNRATVGDSLFYRQGSIDDKLKELTFRLPLMSMLNIKYLVSGFILPAQPNLKLVQTINSTRFNIPVYIYKNMAVLPRVYFANQTTFIGNDELKNLDLITDPKDDFSKNTFIECQTCANFSNTVSKKDSLTISEYKDGALSLKTSVEQGRWLVFSEANLPGWRVTIDGQLVQIYYSNYIFQSVYVPKGQHQVEFKYIGI